jgi:hypothetical protein
MEYLFLLLPLFLLALAWRNNLQFRKFKNTGKIPVIAAARRKMTLYFVLAIAATGVFFLALVYSA